MKIEIDNGSGWYSPCIAICDESKMHSETVYVEISELRKFITDLEQIAKDLGV